MCPFYPEANLYAPPPPYSGKGRPRAKGGKIPTPQEEVGRRKRRARLEVSWYGGGRRDVTAEECTDIALGRRQLIRDQLSGERMLVHLGVGLGDQDVDLDELAVAIHAHAVRPGWTYYAGMKEDQSSTGAAYCTQGCRK